MKKTSPIAIIGIIVVLCCFCCCASSMSTGIIGARSALGVASSTEYKDPVSGKDLKKMTAPAQPAADSKPRSMKPMKVQLYKTRDCSGDPINALQLDQPTDKNPGVPLDTVWTVDKRGKGKEDFACCMKTENADVNATYTLGLDSEKSEHTINIKHPGKLILMEGHKVPPGVFNMHINGPIQCAQNLHLKASPIE